SHNSSQQEKQSHGSESSDPPRQTILVLHNSPPEKRILALRTVQLSRIGSATRTRSAEYGQGFLLRWRLLLLSQGRAPRPAPFPARGNTFTSRGQREQKTKDCPCRRCFLHGHIATMILHNFLHH